MRYFILMLFLCGCTKTVMVPCTKPEIPAEPVYCHVAPGATDRVKAECIAEDVALQRGYIKQLLKVLEGY